MKQLLLQYASYNLWANEIVSDKLSSLPPDLLHENMQDSFGSIFKTVTHLWDVEELWWHRMQGTSLDEWPGINFTGDFPELKKSLLSISSRWLRWIKKMETNEFERIYDYKNSKGKSFRQPLSEVILHLFNHQTFHRGQVIVMLRQNGVKEIPPTDLIIFSRKEQLKEQD